MNEVINYVTENKWVVVVGVILVLIYNNRSFFSNAASGAFSFLSIFKFWGRDKTATQDDRKRLYDSLLRLQDDLAACGVEREAMDTMTLAEIGVLTVSATTALNPSLEEAKGEVKVDFSSVDGMRQ
jgi:hypothetical protein